ncbi:MAG: hypothetical protein IJA34_06170 [Lachnospiraceae bacterium]|nr:hypothetical protein [Lachnospiraceae bacterium]
MKKIDMHEISIVHDWGYGINYKYSVLCKINIITNEIQEVQSILNNRDRLQYVYATEFYRHILATESAVFFIDTCTNKLLIFDEDLHLVQELILQEKNENMNLIGMDSTSVFVYGVSSGIVFEVNIKSKQIKKYKIPEKYEGKINSMEIKIIDHSIWVPGYIGNIVIEIDVISGNIYEHEIDICKGDICLCEKDEKNFWLCTQYELIVWDKKSNKIKQIWELPYEIAHNDLKMPFYYSSIENESLWLFPLRVDFILRMKLQEKIIEIYKVQIDKKISKREKIFSYLSSCKNRKTIYGMNGNMQNVSINVENGEIQYEKYLIEDGLYEQMKKQFYMYNNCLDERMFTISELLDDTYKMNSKKEQIDIGKKIHRCT